MEKISKLSDCNNDSNKYSSYDNYLSKYKQVNSYKICEEENIELDTDQIKQMILMNIMAIIW